MTILLTGVVLIAFLTGLCIGMAKGHESRERLRRACRKLVDENLRLRAEQARQAEHAIIELFRAPARAIEEITRGTVE